MFNDEFFEQVPEGAAVIVRTISNVIEGYHDGTACWNNREETEEYRGIVVSEINGVHTWVPYDTMLSVEFFREG